MFSILFSTSHSFALTVCCDGGCWLLVVWIMQIDDQATKHLTSAHIKRDFLRLKVSRSLSFLETTSQITPSSLARYMCGKIDRKNARLWMCHRRRRKRFANFLEASWRAITAMAIINCYNSLRSPIWIHLSNCTQRHLIALRLFTSIRFLRIFNIFFLSFSIIFFFTSFFFSFTFFSQLENSDFHTFPDTLPMNFLLTQLASALGRRVRILTNFNRQFETIESLKNSLAQTSIVRYFLIHIQV